MRPPPSSQKSQVGKTPCPAQDASQATWAHDLSTGRHHLHPIAPEDSARYARGLRCLFWLRFQFQSESCSALRPLSTHPEAFILNLSAWQNLIFGCPNPHTVDPRRVRTICERLKMKVTLQLIEEDLEKQEKLRGAPTPTDDEEEEEEQEEEGEKNFKGPGSAWQESLTYSEKAAGYGINMVTSPLAALCENAFPCGVCPTPASIRGKNVDFGTRFFWRKHARMQPKMCFPSHARHCFPSTAFSKFLRAPRGFRVRPRRRLFRVRIFQCRLRSTQASVFCPHSYFHASK